MSDTNRVDIGFVREAVLGTTPDNPEFQTLRVTGAPDLAFTPVTVTSEELRADRQVTDLVLVGASSGGGLPAELSFLSFDTLMELALFSLWVSKGRRTNENTPAEITDVAIGQFNVTDVNQPFAEDMMVRASGFAEAANNGLIKAEAGSNGTTLVYTSAVLEAAPPATATLQVVGFEGVADDIEATATGLSSSLLDFTTLNLSVGEFIKIGGTAILNQFGTLPDNEWAVINSIAANALTLDNLPSGWAADVGAGKEIRVSTGDYLRNGVLKQSVTLRETFTDHDPLTYQYLTGQTLAQYSLSAPAQSIINQTFTFQGTLAGMVEVPLVGQTTLPAPLTPVMNSSSNVGRIATGGVPISGQNYVLQADLNFNNNLRYQNAVGSIAAVGIGAGEFGMTGTLNTYFDNKDIAEQIINNTESSFDMRVNDSAGHTLVYFVPRLKYSSGAPTVPGKNQDVTLNAGFQGILSPTYGFTMQIGRFWELM